MVPPPNASVPRSGEVGFDRIKTFGQRHPTEVRATAGGFCYHQGTIFGGLTAPILTYLAINLHLGFAIPMLIGTMAGAASFIVALLLSPETRGRELVADVVLA